MENRIQTAAHSCTGLEAYERIQACMLSVVMDPSICEQVEGGRFQTDKTAG